MASPKTILLLDDCTTIRSILKVFMMDLGTCFLESDDGNAALSILRESAVDMVIADVRMDPMDGITFLRQVRANPKTHDLPVILLTCDRDAELRRRGLEAGASAFIQKPVTCQALRSTIERVSAQIRGLADLEYA
jgi:two-component system, chemotaxis family, chemotaxis protein CheY